MSRKSRERVFEDLVESDKPYKKVMALKDVLLREPENVVRLSELGSSARARVGLAGKSRFASLMSKHPSVFDLHKDEENHLWCGFTPRAQILVDSEIALAKRYEETVGVHNLRKLLMMSVEHRIRVPKLAHLRRDLGLPTDFHDRMIYAYPEYFRVTEERYRNEDGPVLELISWDPSLAVTSVESGGELNASGQPLFKMCVNKSLRLSKKQWDGIDRFQAHRFISPYQDSKEFDKNTPVFEKRQVALVHEILSMTIEKKTVVDYLTHFRKEYRLPHSVLALALRHPSIFYVSRKGGRFTIFLKEAYEDGKLIRKNEWNVLKDQYFDLINANKSKSSTVSSSLMDAYTCNLDEVQVRETAEPVVQSCDVDADFDALLALCRKMKKRPETVEYEEQCEGG
jgi:hypothetical protein